MAVITRFEEIHAWQLARKDAAGSTMHNIAEGFEAGSDAEFARFLRYTRRSATEVQSELYVALDQRLHYSPRIL